MSKEKLTREEKAGLDDYIKSQGIVFSENPEALATMISYIAEVPEKIRSMVDEKVDYYFVFKRHPDCDGRTQRYYHEETKKNCYAIGISETAVAQGKDYATMVWLHECAHLLTDFKSDHGELFHNYLDYLLLVYNQETGREIENDYRPYDPEEP